MVTKTSWQRCGMKLLYVTIVSGVLGGIRGYTAYTDLWVFLTAYTHLSDHKISRVPSGPLPRPFAYTYLHF